MITRAAVAHFTALLFREAFDSMAGIFPGWDESHQVIGKYIADDNKNWIKVCCSQLIPNPDGFEI